MAAPLSMRPQRSSSKRSRSHESIHPEQETTVPEPPIEQTDHVPAFLRQSTFEIHNKFEELEWLQQIRIAHGRNESNPLSQWAQETSLEARSRNRYVDVQAWANSRIRLKVPEGHCDYINASPISLRNTKTGKEERYIATQGPKRAQLNHIWHMIWHETSEVAVIVMLTQIYEASREKCFQYFPLDLTNDTLIVNEINEFDDGFKARIQLLELTTDERKRITTRKLSMTVNEENKIIWHLAFSGWPDFGVPEGDDRLALFELLNMSADKNTTAENPRIVHCSAGVGRSGTFIALDHLFRELDAGVVAAIQDDEDMIFDTVNKLREQRMTMVQSDAQYQFLYDALRGRFEEKQATALSRPPTHTSAETGPDNEERSPKVARVTKAADAVTTPYSDKQNGIPSVTAVDSS
ncbi:hypothetical protein MMC16_003306 [Acarospora aff. strigata]|nr:hypothetical protein [Acarospora aff. strigata]